MIRIASLNLAYDERLATPDALLDAYHTLTGWSAALARAGALVHVVQRFATAAGRQRDEIDYSFVADDDTAMPRPWDRLTGAAGAVLAARPDIVHVNGLMFPGAVRTLREVLPRPTAIVLQDHSGALPRSLPWPLDRLSATRWAEAFAAADACTFTAAALAERWRPYGLPASLPILEIPEASTTLAPIDREAAVVQTAMTGQPALLWVGRLEPNKDPFTLLDALERALPALPEARCTMIFDAGRLERDVRARVAASSLLSGRVTLTGAVRHDRMAAYYSAADVFLSASHHEGSGYALIEALACGVTPCVTTIPAFRARVGPVGACWAPGDPADGARALLARARTVTAAERTTRRRRFDETLHWDAIGRRTLEQYERIVAGRLRTL
jgi:glycosyltransferase involved in cell wall biosynthesis